MAENPDLDDRVTEVDRGPRPEGTCSHHTDNAPRALPSPSKLVHTASIYILDYLNKLHDLQSVTERVLIPLTGKLNTLETWERNQKLLRMMAFLGGQDHYLTSRDSIWPLLLVKYYMDVAQSLGGEWKAPQKLSCSAMVRKDKKYQGPQSKKGIHVQDYDKEILKMLNSADIFKPLINMCFSKIVAILQTSGAQTNLQTEESGQENQDHGDWIPYEDEDLSDTTGTTSDEVDLPDEDSDEYDYNEDVDSHQPPDAYDSLSPQAKQEVYTDRAHNLDLSHINQMAALPPLPFPIPDSILHTPLLPFTERAKAYMARMFAPWNSNQTSSIFASVLQIINNIVTSLVTFLVTPVSGATHKREICTIQQHPVFSFLLQHASCLARHTFFRGSKYPHHVSPASRTLSSLLADLAQKTAVTLMRSIEGETLIAQEHMRILMELEDREGATDAISAILRQYEDSATKMATLLYTCNTTLNTYWQRLLMKAEKDDVCIRYCTCCHAYVVNSTATRPQ